MNALTIYTRSMIALALPAATWWFVRSVYGEVFVERVGEWHHGRRLLAIMVLILCAIVLHYLGILFGLIRARGRADLFNVRRANPTYLARLRRRRFRMAAAASAVLAAFFMAEVVFRVLDIRPPPLSTSAIADYYAVDNTLNALGMREPWDSLPEDERRLRIVFLGDSMVYGDGVERHESFCSLVEALVTTERPEGVRTINLGFRGTAPAWQLEKFLAVKDAIHADVVVHVVYPNDLEIDMHKRLNEIYRLQDDALWVGETSYVLRYAERTIRYWVGWRRTIDYFRGGRDSAERTAAWAKFRADVVASKSAVEETGAVYCLVLFPWLVRLDDYLLPDVHAILREFASQLDVPYLDLLEVFAGRNAETLRVSLANEHPNAEGHRIAAERIARFLREEVLPAPQVRP